MLCPSLEDDLAFISLWGALWCGWRSSSFYPACIMEQLQAVHEGTDVVPQLIPAEAFS